MIEPTTSTAITVSTAIAAATAPIVFNALPWFGDHGIVIGAAIAVAIVKTGMRDTDTWWQTIRLFLSIVLISLFMTGTFAALLQRWWQLPGPVLLSITSFALGLAYGEWGNIFNKLLDWGIAILPARKEDKL